MTIRQALLAATFALTTTFAAHAQTEVKHIQTARSFIASGVWAGDTYYLSGQTADPLPPVAGAPASAPRTFGDMKTQALSVYGKIQKSLQDQGLDMKDVVKVTVFMAADPTTGKLAFAEMNSAFMQYFGTKDQPNKPARSAVQVAALVAPGALLEVEVIAVRQK
jgi:enamine deaminase RidA (YjgF/YER057c/UK114 family)